MSREEAFKLEPYLLITNNNRSEKGNNKNVMSRALEDKPKLNVSGGMYLVLNENKPQAAWFLLSKIKLNEEQEKGLKQ